MSKFTTGRWAFGICDRCGTKEPYKDLRKEWTGLKVCSSCFEIRHELLDPIRHVYDPQALKEPRPDQDDDGGVTTQLSTVVPATHGDRGI